MTLKKMNNKMKAKHNYDITLSWSHADECWVALVPDLPGCMADGETPEAAAAAAQEAMEAWLEAAPHFNHPVPVETPGVENLVKAGEVLNTSALARMLGMQPRTLTARIANGTPLSYQEAENLKAGLRARGIAFV